MSVDTFNGLNLGGTFGGGASFGVGRVHRYRLWRQLTGDSAAIEREIAFVGLNPSTADETANDPTVRRCIRFASDWGFGWFWMLNAYAFRATDPREMKRADDPVGVENDETLRRVARRCQIVVACWGNHCTAEREREVLTAIDRPVHCLATTKSGRPGHPLYLRADTKPKLFWMPER